MSCLLFFIISISVYVGNQIALEFSVCPNPWIILNLGNIATDIIKGEGDKAVRNLKEAVDAFHSTLSYFHANVSIETLGIVKGRYK